MTIQPKNTPDCPILYQDPYIVVCAKPVGLASQPTAAGQANLLEILSERYIGVGLVHRLDTLTGGVMVFATRERGALGTLCTTVQDHALFTKEYLAVTDHAPTPSFGEMHDRLYHDSRLNKSFTVKGERKGSKAAALAYRVLDTKNDGLSLVHVRLHTGRTHQIRVQFGSRGYPLCGDGKYGSRNNNRCRCALWSYRISFPHPVSGEHVSFACLPDLESDPWTLFSQDIYQNIEII